MEAITLKLKPTLFIIAGLLLIAGLVFSSSTLYPDFGKAVLSRLNLGPKEPEGKSLVQLSYEKACRLMRKHDTKRAKIICLDLLKHHADDEIAKGKNVFLVAPAMLDMLGALNIGEKNGKAAMACYQKMEKNYKDSYFSRYTEEEESWSGKAGAWGIIGQIHVVIGLDKNYTWAKQLAYKLMDEYKGQTPQIWTGGYSYEEVAKDYILNILDKTHVTPDQREEEYRRMIERSGNNALAAGLLIDLAGRARKAGDELGASQLYLEVIDKYGTVYVGDIENDYEFFGLRAYQGLVEIYRQQGSENKLDNAKYEMRDLYNKIVRDLKGKNDYENAENFLTGYEESFKSIGVDTGEVETGEPEDYGD